MERSNVGTMSRDVLYDWVTRCYIIIGSDVPISSLPLYITIPNGVIEHHFLLLQTMSQVASYSEKSDTKHSANATPPHKLPIRGGWQIPLVLYKNYWLHPNRIDNIIFIEEHFTPRHDDVILITYPKCGTTWLKALAFAVMSRSHYGFADHPLLTQHPQQVVPSIEILDPGSEFVDIEKLPSPRLIATHLPLSLLPPAITSCGCRIVYLCREPKDAFNSWWHHYRNPAGCRVSKLLPSAFCRALGKQPVYRVPIEKHSAK